MSKPRYFDFAWREGSTFSGDPEGAWRAIEEIRQRDGGSITPDAVVNAAENKASPLHHHFDWNDETAARQWRIVTARKLISAIKCRYPEAPDKPRERVFVNVLIQPSDADKNQHTHRIYSDMREALEDPDQRAYIIGEALREIGLWRKRYSELNELGRIFEALDDLDAA